MEVGVDFGTTYSTVAYSSEGTEGCLKVAGSYFVPTCLFVEDRKKRYYIGNLAVSKSKEKVGRLYINLKRWIGVTDKNVEEYKRKLKNVHSVEVRDKYDIRIGGIGNGDDVKIGVTTLIYLYLKALIIEVEGQLKSSVSGMVCSVPADYNSFKRSYLAVAIEPLKRNIRALVNEPTAAALYSLAISGMPNKVVSVFDFGGGTFDVSILVRSADVYAVVYSIGDNYLGGRDVDRAIIDEVYRKMGGIVSLADLTTVIQSVKEDVSLDPTITEHLVHSNGKIHKFNFTYQDLERISQPFIARAVKLFNSGLRELKYPSTVVILTGGSCGLPGIEQQLYDLSCVEDVYFNKKDFRVSVAAGAKVYCDALSAKSSVRLIDTLTHSLSDELSGFNTVLVFPKGSIVPNETEVKYNISGTATKYGVFEGESRVSWRNELTYVGTHRRVVNYTKEDVVKYYISIDGRLSMTVDGVAVKNDMQASQVEDKYYDYEYLDDLSQGREKYLPEYLKDINLIYKTNLAEEGLLKKITEKQIDVPEDLLG